MSSDLYDVKALPDSNQHPTVHLQVVQDTVTEAVQDAVAAAFEENGRFDVRANFYTLIAITGVVLYWRGVWNSWSVHTWFCQTDTSVTDAQTICRRSLC